MVYKGYIGVVEGYIKITRIRVLLENDCTIGIFVIKSNKSLKIRGKTGDNLCDKVLTTCHSCRPDHRFA